MCGELIDLRAKITHETDAYLDSMTKATGKDRSELVREILHHYALEEIDKCIKQHKVLCAKGLAGDRRGHGRESKGGER